MLAETNTSIYIVPMTAFGIYHFRFLNLFYIWIVFI